MSNNLLSQKSTLTSRRNIVIYIIATILILGIVAGFTNTFHTDNTRHAAGYGETIVMEAEPPASGNPGDYDLLSNLKFTAYKLHHSNYFKGFTKGTVSADIGIGSYTQYLTNTRIVYNKNANESIVFAETISSSSLKSLAEQKYIHNDIVIYRPAEKISGSSVTYKSNAMQMSFDDFSGKYGSVPNQLSKYIINEKTILSVKDENAQKASPLNSDGSGIGFNVPDKLVQGADGNYVFTLTLDPTESSKYYRNEVRTLGGADQNPKFYSVKITVTVNAQWIPLSTRTLEEYDIEIPVLGAMRCSGDNYEEFSMIDDPNGEIPEQDFFQPYVDEAKSKPGYVPPAINVDGPLSASDYLASAFACYLSGEKNLDLNANIKVTGVPLLGELSAYDLTLSVNLNTLDIQAMLGGGLYVKYAGGKIYIKNNDINGYIDTNNIDKLTSDPTLKGLLGGMGELDLTKIFGGDMLDVIFRDCEMTTENGVTEIPMAFTLDLSDVISALSEVKVNASIMINDEDKSLKSITGKVTIGEVIVDIDVQPLAKDPKFPATDGAVNLSGIIDFVPDILSTAMQKTYGIDGEITLNGMTVGVSAYIDRTNGLKADAVLNIMGLDVNVKYANDVIYIDALGVTVIGTAEELPALLEAVLDLTGFSKYQSLLSAMLPSSVNEIANMLKTLTVDDATIAAELKFIGIPIDVKLTRDSGKLSALALKVNVDLFGIKADVAADLNISEPESREVTAPTADSYLTFADLATLIAEAKPYLQDDTNYIADIDGSVDINGTKTEIGGSFVIDKVFDDRKQVAGVAASGTLNALGQSIDVTYADGAAYVAIGNIKAKLDLTDAGSLLSSILDVVRLATGNDAQLPEIDIIEILHGGAIKSASMTDGTLNAVLAIEGCNAEVALNLKSGKIGVTVKIDGISVKLDITIAAVKNNHNITVPDGAYVNAAELSALIDAAKTIIEQKSALIPTAVAYGGKTYAANIAVDFADGIKAQIAVPEFGLDIILIGDTAYISIGQIKLCGSLAEAKDLYAEVRKHYTALPELGALIAIPQDLDIEGLIGTALGSVKSLTAENGVIRADVEFDGFGVSAGVNADLSEITVNANGVTVVMHPEFKAVAIDKPNGAYSSIAQITALVPTVFELVESTAFGVTFNATAAGYNVDGSATIDIANGIKANATANAFGQTVNISFIDDVVYAELQAIRVKFATADANKWLQPITNLFGAFGIALPDIGEITNGPIVSLDPENILQLTLTALDCIKSFTIKDGVIAIKVEYGEYAAKLAIAVTSSSELGAEINVKLDIDGLGSVDATVTATDEQIVEPEYADYSDVTELIPAIETATQIVTARGISAVATVAIGDVTLKANISATIEDGALKVLVTEDALGLKVTLLGDTAYIEVGGIKVSGQLADIDCLIDAVIPNLPYTIQPYIHKMNELMMGVMPSDEELGAENGEIEIAKAIDTVLDMICRLSIADGEITLEVRRGVFGATLGVATDLSRIGGNISMTFNDIGGPFGDRYVMAFDIGLDGIAAKTVTIPQIKAEEYVAASNIITVAKSVLPLVKERALELDVNVTVFGQAIRGNLYVDFGEYTLDTVAFKANIIISDASIAVAVIEKTLYLDINGGSVRLAQPLTKDGIKALISQIDQALPELGLSDKISQKLDELKEALSEGIDIGVLLEMITLSPIDNGMSLQVETNGAIVSADVIMIDSSIMIDAACDINGKQITIGLKAITDSGVVTSIETTQADVMGTEFALDAKLTPAECGKATVTGDYITADDIIPYISPITELINKATKSNTITFDLSGMTLEVMGKIMNVTGKVDLSLDPIMVRAVLTLFAGTADAIDLTVVYSDNVLYVELGEIRLKFDVENDIGRLLEAIQDYLPPSLKNLGNIKELSTISALVKDVKALIGASDITEALSILFDYNAAYGKSMVKQVLDMIRLGVFNDKLTASLTVMESPEVTINVSPTLSADGAYVDFVLSTAIMNLLKVDCTVSLSFSNAELNFVVPKADDYVSVIDFVTTVVNAVNTLTAKMPETETTENGVTTNVKTIAFSADLFAFDYDIFKAMQTVNENGETVDVTDPETGRVVIEEADGKKVVKQHIDVNSIAGKPALAFKYVTATVTENGITTKSSKVYIEAHISLGIKELDKDNKLIEKPGFPIELDLFVAPTEQYPDGLAYLHYRESNGYGEKISLDYNSIMEIVAAVLDILSVDDQTVESLLGKYRLDIDKTVFNSMSIAGLDSITELLNNLIKAVDEAKLALGDVKDVLSIVYAENDIMNLIAQFRDDKDDDGNPTAKTLLSNAIDKVKTIIAYFATDDGETDDEQEEPNADDNKINGALFGKVVNAVSFASTGDALSAKVSNEIATGTKGDAIVEVTSNGNKINSIGVDNLDVNTAKLNTFDLQFTAGEDLFADGNAFDITVPESEFVTSGNTSYSNLANIKHLLFDVMNTANMLEFDIGGLNTSDVINVKLSVVGLDLVDININYNVKVKIINTGEDENGKPIYKTAAAMELMFKNCTALSATVVPNCTTRLYFYDDVIYIQGVRAGHADKVERVVGTITDVTCIADVWGRKETRYPKINSTEYVHDTTGNLDYIEVMYTVDELFWMIQNNMNTFLSEFLFYLVPLSRDFTIAHIDLQSKILEAMTGSSDSTSNPQNTIAQIFKEYAYNNGEHTMRIGLKELAGSSALSDLTVKITGKNDNDDDVNVKNNYISKLHVDTDIQNKLVQISLDATLNNVRETTDGRIESKGLAATNVTREVGKYSANSANYVYDCYHYDRNTLYTLDGKTYLTPDGDALYIENGSFAPALRRTDSSDVFVWTSTSANTRYCNSVYKFGDTGATYYYTTSLSGYGYRYDGTDTYYIGTNADGSKYVYRVENGNQVRVAVKGITTSLLAEVTRNAQGKIASVTNRNGGIQWVRPWQSAYEAAQAAA
ncbi:MAG: hypothetical protein K2O04_05720 [Clostridiales bacterium]|nr:hypothetical protein [Clostridiales bacterium]